MVQFRGGFISGQTGDRSEKPETEIQESGESQESRKVVVPENGKSKIIIIAFPCGS